MWVPRGRCANLAGWPRHEACFESSPMPSDVKSRPQVTKEQEVWVVRVERAGGKQQEYRCATEAQARQLVAALTPQPA
jgi:hypothetical protein